MFVTTQYVTETSYCDLVGIMNEGHLLALDSPTGLRHRVLGGDVVDLRTRGPISYQQEGMLGRLPFLKRPPRRMTDDHLRLTVEDAGTAMPEIIARCKESNMDVESIEEYVPPFDDVFVELFREDNRRA